MPAPRPGPRSGFSLVELVLVVAILGILASIALPNYLTMQLRAKRSELLGNLGGIKTAQIAYDAAHDRYLDLEEAPTTAGAGGKVPVAWDGAAVDGDWALLGWAPDGQVRGLYSADTNTTGCTHWTSSRVGPNFCVTGLSDVDGNGAQARHYADLDHNAELVDHEVY